MFKTTKHILSFWKRGNPIFLNSKFANELFSVYHNKTHLWRLDTLVTRAKLTLQVNLRSQIEPHSLQEFFLEMHL